MFEFYFSNKGMFTRKNFWLGVITTGVFFTFLNTLMEVWRLDNIIISLSTWVVQIFVLYNIYEKRLNHVGKYHKVLHVMLFCLLIFIVYSLGEAFNLFSGQTVLIVSFFSTIILSIVLLVICGFFPGNSKMLPGYDFSYNGKNSNILLKNLHKIKSDFAPDFSTSGVLFVKDGKYDVYFDSETYKSSDKNGELYVFHLKDIH